MNGVQDESWCEVSNSLQREGEAAGYWLVLARDPALPEILIWGRQVKLGGYSQYIQILAILTSEILEGEKARGVEIFVHITSNPPNIGSGGSRRQDTFLNIATSVLKLLHSITNNQTRYIGIDKTLYLM